MTSLTVREAFNGSMNSKNSPAVRSIRILPQQPSNSLGGKCPVVANHGVSAVKPDSFFEAFGSIGILLLLGAGVSVCWTAWLTILSIAPNDTANYLMDTADLDDGYFWLIADPEPELMSVNTFVLVGLAVSYIHVMLKMTVLRNSSFRIAPVGPRREEVSVSPIWAARLPHIGDYLQQAASFWLELTGYYGQYRKFWNVLFKVGDLIVESIQLNHLLEAGFSVSLCYGYTALISMSCLSQAFFILHPVAHSAFTEVLVDTVFDMTFAVGCPIFLLGYSYTMFNLDRGIARLNLRVYPPGSFQRQARMQADPIATTLFRFCFDSMRTLTWSSLLIRLVMNISFSYRLTRLVEVIYQRRKNTQTTSSKVAKLKAQRDVPRWVGVVFLTASAFALAYTGKAIAESQNSCNAHPQCVAFAYRWDQQDACPCLALVDVDKAPKTYEEWIHPIDVSEIVRTLALSGDLQVLQLTNRQMTLWPEELQRCTNLVYLSLCYTGVEIIPDWFKVFHKLEFFDIEGKFGDTNVVKMPSDAFSRLNSLTFLHFGYLPLLLELPSFKGLSNLKSMSLAILLSISSLPELKPLVKLQRLELVAMYSLQRLPDLTSNQHLKHLFLVNAPLCCNGFLSKCNQSHPACNGPTCLPSSDHISDANLAIFTTQPVACDPNALYFPPPQPIAKYQVDMCGGVMYRRCYDPVYQSADVEVVGICMNNFFQVISCSSSDIYAINGRQQEIIHGFGLPCDPVEEAWLGCVKP
ncbi:hypothetical protein PF011_g24998 [Phytophthora fragariae]|uniref:WLGC domain-containing protein n=4 Tax=Phytophthora fragariae TaxID=53985 RepID=A0A6A3I1Q5_9STRA|nr:hypothetical protein PF003_g34835 [Phytophthora fragariae]KAE8923050.1 hypothetical protein PF009_g26695 [Phytophthora fragariae]KAE8974083.1 hypothetical protein PF011_g24998 [Phytophthora fragariae]